MKRKAAVSLLIWYFLVFTSCTRCTGAFTERSGGKVFSPKDSIYCVTYNAQTFFDAVTDGREFAQFKGKKTKWSPEIYQKRLERLREVGELAVYTMGGGKNRMPDIFVLEEIESERVINDFSKLFSQSAGYPYAVFFPPEKSGNFATAIFSKFPVIEYEQFKLTSSEFENDRLRPLIKATVEINYGDRCEYITVFANHWKSKLGDKTELIRQAQERQLMQKVRQTLKADPEANIIVCGDFNQKSDEFSGMEGLTDSWHTNWQTLETVGISGSYWYDDLWEDIDHIFYSTGLNDGAGLDIVDFAPIAVKPLITDAGRPNEFKVYTGNGYSDHLPLCAVIEFLGRH